MKKALIIVLFLFLLSGCNVKKDLLGVSRINESSVCEEYCLLELKVISSTILNDIQVESLYVDTIYDYQVVNSIDEVKLNNDIYNKIYNYDLKIKIYYPTKINNVDLKINNKIHTFDIGSFKCLSIDQKDYEPSTYLKCLVEDNKIKLKNLTDRPILINNIEVLSNDNIRVCKNLETNIIKAIDTKCMAYVYLEMDDLYKMNYYLKVDYTYNGDCITNYFKVDKQNISKSSSSIGSYILVDEACFVKSYS